jgi:hypothetical protein
MLKISRYLAHFQSDTSRAKRLLFQAIVGLGVTGGFVAPPPIAHADSNSIEKRVEAVQAKLSLMRTPSSGDATQPPLAQWWNWDNWPNMWNDFSNQWFNY